MFSAVADGSITLDPGQILTALITFVGIIATLGGVIWAASRTRASSKEVDATRRIELALEAQDERIKSLEAEVKLVREDLAAEKDRNKKQLAELQRIKKVVSDWIKAIAAQWVTFTDEPMPMVSDEDLALLEISMPVTAPLRRTTRPRKSPE